MSGRYSGLQARLKVLNPAAVFVSCAGHSLNLVGVKAAECCAQVVAFFDFVRKLYTFFSASTHRWAILTPSVSQHCSVVKRLSDTRWSAHADAVKALCEGYENIQLALDSLADDVQQPKDTRLEAQSLKRKMDKLETVILTLFWNDVLSRYNDVSKTVQKQSVNLGVVVSLLQSLKLFTDSLRDRFAGYESKARAIAKHTEYTDSTRRALQRSRQITFLEGPAPDTILDASNKFKVETYLAVIDSLVQGLSQRLAAYENIYGLFGFFAELQDMDVKAIEEGYVKLAAFYKEDLDQQDLISECQHFKHHARCQRQSRDSEPTMSDLYRLVKTDSLESTFPTIEIALRIYLSLMPTNCTGERSFSKLKIIKSHLRNCMLQPRVTALTLMSIESDILEDIDFSDIVHSFAAKKSRKKYF